MKKTIPLIILFLIGLSEVTVAQVVHFSDTKFKSLLVENEEINTNNDKDIQTAEAIAYRGNIKVGFEGLTSLNGIEAFVNLKGLWCNSNKLTVLDISKNTSLTQLWCWGNSITHLDLAKNITLTTLVCYSNKLASLDISKNKVLTIVQCGQNPIKHLNTHHNEELKELYCDNNQLIKLDVSKNIYLVKIIQ